MRDFGRSQRLTIKTKNVKVYTVTDQENYRAIEI